MTVHVPLALLGQLRADGFDWLVPGLRLELVTALIRSLPKELRRPLVPVPRRRRPGRSRGWSRAREPLLDALSRASSGRCAACASRARRGTSARLPPHLRMTLPRRGRGRRGARRGRTTSRRCARRCAPRLRAELAAAHRGPRAQRAARRGRSATLPRTVALPGTPAPPCGLPGARRRGRRASACACSRRPPRRRAAMRAGTRRLLLLDDPVAAALRAGPARDAAQLALAVAPHGSVRRGARGRLVAAVDALVAAGGRAGVGRGRVRAAARPRRRRAWPRRRCGSSSRSRASSTPSGEVRRRLEPLHRRAGRARAPRRRSASSAGSCCPGFVAATGAARLADVERYLRAAARRLERLPDVVATDRDRMRAVARARGGLRAAARRLAARAPAAAGAARGALGARGAARQPVRAGPGHAQAVSAKRIRRVLEEAALAGPEARNGGSMAAVAKKSSCCVERTSGSSP